MAMTESERPQPATGQTAGEDLDPTAPEDPRDAWLSLALADLDCRASALATAARGGRPLPRRVP